MKKTTSIALMTAIALISGIFSLTATTPAHAWNLQGSCTATPSTADIGTTITWSATQSSTMKPSEGHYEWVWSGTDGLSGTTQSVGKSYSTAGTKNATVIIKMVLNSGLVETITRTCTVTITTPPPPALNASCAVTPTSIQTGGSVTWSALATGGTGTYTYSWSGTDGLSGTTQTLPKTYNSPGTKTGTVVVTSGNQSITKNCTVTVTQTPPPFVAACSVTPSSVQVGGSVTYSATASGGTGTYTYAWSGDESLTGNTANVSKTYSTTGTKTGTVVVTSGAESITKNCTVTVTQTPPPFEASCSVSPSSINVGGTLNWSATASGGTGNYTYSWSGDEGLSATTQNISKSYSTTGTKTGTVVVTSGSDSLTRSCTASVSQPPTGCTSNCGGGGLNQPNVVLFQKATKQPLAFVYLSQIPYTGLGGPTTVIIFFIGIVLWAAGLVVVFRSNRVQELLHHFGWGRVQEFVPAGAGFTNESVSIESPFAREILNDYAYDGKSKPPPINLPVGEFRTSEVSSSDVESELAIRAKRDHTLISPDGLTYIIEKAHAMGVSPSALLDQTIDRAKTLFTREDGWLLLNRAKVLQAVVQEQDNGNEHEDLVLGNPVTPAPVQNYQPSAQSTYQPPVQSVYQAPVQQPVHQDRDAAKHIADVNTFVNLLVRGDEREVFSFLRGMREAGSSVEQFVRMVVLDLDEVFRSRVEREAARNNIVLSQIASKWSENDLERVISILLTIVDQSYKDSKVSAKLASMRIASLKN